MDIDWLSKALKHYNTPEVAQALVASARDKEAVGSFGGEGYAKRPDTLLFPNDVLEQVKKGVTSFHISEETWRSPLSLKPGMHKKDQDMLRKGWDLVIDIDCIDWELSRISTHLIVKALQDFGITAISVKFSGNKGFHIGVPFESFSPTITLDLLDAKGEKIEKRQNVAELFPDAARNIAALLLEHITKKYTKVENDTITIDGKMFAFSDLEKRLKTDLSSLSQIHCASCSAPIKRLREKTYDYICTSCGNTDRKNAEEMREIERSKPIITCSSCGSLMGDRAEIAPKVCEFCDSTTYVTSFDPSKLIEVDTILISSRHLFRAPYSLHEKSGLVSIPIDHTSIMLFDKAQAEPGRITFTHTFLDRQKAVPGEADHILVQSHVAALEREQKEMEQAKHASSHSRKRQGKFVLNEKLPAENFPPCILNILNGLNDGRKRCMFVLANFLTSVGWTAEEARVFMMEWNKRNPDPLRDTLIVGQMRGKANNQMPPPNCDNKMYYQDLGICKPDAFCGRIKNPASYTIKKSFIGRKPKNAPDDDRKKEIAEKARKTRDERKRFREDVQRKRENGEM